MAIDHIGDGAIESRELAEEMRSSYMDYAMSVIVGRALPDVRDGLKPVHRRVLYSMQQLGLQPNRPYVKCAKVVGECMGDFHPHGDSAIYDTLVRLAQSVLVALPAGRRPGQLRQRSTATARPPCATRSAGSRPWRSRCCATSTRTSSTSSRTTTSA